MAQDYYKTLDVSRTASLEEIRKSYRNLARKYHPDLHPDDVGAKKKFQEVQSAFDVLNDSKQKDLYDRYGENYEAFQGGAPGGGGRGPSPGPGTQFNFDDLFGGGGMPSGGAPGGNGGGFADLFRQFTGGSGGQRTAAPSKGHDVEQELTVPFSVAVKGGQAQISIQRPTGKVENITISVPAGIENGKKLRLSGLGDPSPTGDKSGDILVLIHVAAHPCYKRKGNRLDVVVPLTLAEAVDGAQVELPTPKGTITLTIPPGTSSGQKLRIKGHGIEPKGKTAGDLFAEIQIQLPKDLSEEDRKKIVEIIGDTQEFPREKLQW